VSRVQAEGNLKIEDETQKRIDKSANLVIATYLTGPISVLPLKVPDEKATETAKPTTPTNQATATSPTKTTTP